MTLTRKVGAGGEAEVYEVAERPGVVCKRYRTPTPERAAKLQVMVASPPHGTTAGGHVSIAWPIELVDDGFGGVSGFLMPRIDVRSAIPVFQVYNPASRLRVAPGFTWRYLLRTARNVAAIVDSLHGAGYVVGDLNESNLLVDRRALVSLVDCDSMQVTDSSTGEVHRSPVGKPEFLAPELHGLALADVDRSEATDAFALAVLMCQLLLEGVHPFAGVWRGRGEPPDIGKRIRKGWVAHRRFSPVDPPPFAVGLDVLPADLRRLARRGLSTRASRRPAAWEWVAALEAADAHLRTCRRSPHHLYAASRRRLALGCPWCVRIDRGLPDPFPGPLGVSSLTRRPPPARTRAFETVRHGIRVARSRKDVVLVAGLAAAGWAWPLVVVPLVVFVVVPALRVGRAEMAAEGRRWSPVRLARWTAASVRRLAAAVRDSALLATASVPAAAGLVLATASIAGSDAGWEDLVRAIAAVAAALHPVARRR